MTRVHNEHWTIVFINKRQEEAWIAACDMLDAGYKWQVDCALNYIVTYTEPWKKYKNRQCPECVGGAYLLDVSHQGIGDKTVEILVWFDVENRTLTPLHCELV